MLKARIHSCEVLALQKYFCTHEHTCMKTYDAFVTPLNIIGNRFCIYTLSWVRLWTDLKLDMHLALAHVITVQGCWIFQLFTESILQTNVLGSVPLIPARLHALQSQRTSRYRLYRRYKHMVVEYSHAYRQSDRTVDVLTHSIAMYIYINLT